MSQPFSVFSGSGVVVAAFSPTYAPYIISPPTQHLRQTASGGSSVTTVNDAKLNHSVSSTQVSDWQVGLSLPLSVPEQIYASDNTAVATIDQSGLATWVSNGTANITLSGLGIGYSVPLSLTFSTVGGQASNTFNSWVVGSLGENATAQIETAITGVATFSGIKLYSTMNWGAGDGTGIVMVRNSSCWANSLAGLTSIAVGTFQPGGNPGTGCGLTAIAPDIVMGADHPGATFPSGSVGVGTTVYFVTSDNTIVSRRLISGGQVGATDIHLYRLDSSLPGGIASMPFLPSNLTSYIPGYTWGVPMFTVNGQMNALVYWWFAGPSGLITSELTTDAATVNLWQILHNNNPSYSAPPNSSMILGDSGHLGCLVVNGSLAVLMTGWHTPNQGPSSYDNITAINSEIAALGSSSTVTVASLAGFPTY